LTVHGKSRFYAGGEVLAVFCSEKYGGFVELMGFFGVIGTLSKMTLDFTMAGLDKGPSVFLRNK